ncbi:MAG: hypothetical protein GXY76_17025 [Chloroflexi bacterium]|nr:hypothetical protein [Chloroflexota bacterium]
MRRKVWSTEELALEFDAIEQATQDALQHSPIEDRVSEAYQAGYANALNHARRAFGLATILRPSRRGDPAVRRGDR